MLSELFNVFMCQWNNTKQGYNKGNGKGCAANLRLAETDFHEIAIEKRLDDSDRYKRQQKESNDTSLMRIGYDNLHDYSLISNRVKVQCCSTKLIG